MKRVSLLYIVIIACSAGLNGQYQQHRTMTNNGPGAYSLLHTDVFSFTSNPAALAQLKNTSAGIAGERRYLLPELNSFTAVAGIPTASGCFGLQIGYTGFSEYNETGAGLVYGRKLGTKVDAGARFNYYVNRISSYGSTSAISIGLGTIWHVTEKLHTGIYINNPAGGKFGKESREKLPSIYTVGFGFDASDKFYTSIEIEKEEDQPVNVIAVIQYKFIPQLFLRVGISSATSFAWGGAGLLLKSFHVEVMTSYHPQLGITPGLLVLFNLNKNGK
ncbi:MAG: hypothetical protein ABIT05_03070 [Chitinophagaceae bacterium]